MTRSSSVNLTRSPGDFSQLPTNASVETTDDQVVQECLAGNWEAFNQLVYKYRNLIGDVVARLLADRSEVDDIVQETFVEAMRLLRRYRPEGRFDRWLVGVAINKTRNHRRGRWVRTVLRLDDLPDSDDHLVDAVSLSANGSTPGALARDALARLRQRAVLAAIRRQQRLSLVVLAGDREETAERSRSQ